MARTTHTVCLSSFTNPHEQRVHQVMLDGMPITREFHGFEGLVTCEQVAYAEYAKLTTATLTRWDGDSREEIIVESKQRGVCAA